MATMIELLGAQAVQQNTQSPLEGVNSGIKTGMALAQVKQQIEGQKLEQQSAQAKIDQDKMNGLGNRLRASLFSSDKSTFDSRMKLAEAYAAQANIPFNAQAIRDSWQDDQKRLVMQNGIKDVLTGKTPVSPTEFLSLMGSQEGIYNFAEAGLLKAADAEVKLQKAQHAVETEKRRADDADQRILNQESNQKYKVINDAKNKLDSAIKEDLDSLQSADKAQALLASGGAVADEASRRVIAKMFDKGVLSDKDVSGISGGKGLLDKGRQLIETAASGKLTDKNREELLTIVRTLKPAIEKKIRERVERDANAQEKIAKAAGYTITKQNFMDAYGIDDLLKSDDVTPQVPLDGQVAGTKPPPTKKSAKDYKTFLEGKKLPPDVVAQKVKAAIEAGVVE